MSKEEILEGNKLIAKFMYEKSFNDDGEDCYCESYGGMIDFYIENAKYHKSWDWLMPVVEKIEQFNNGDFKFSHGSKKNGKYQSMIYSTPTHFIAESTNKIDSVYNVIIKFIKWINQNELNETN